MKAISLWQPWASLVVLGAKRIETRSWGTPHRGPLAIHASKTFSEDCRDLCHADHFREVLERNGLLTADCERLPLGSVLGTVELVDCLPIMEKRLTRGRACIAFDDEGILRVWWPFEFGKVAGHSGDGHQDLAEHERHFGDYRPGRVGWLMRNPVALPSPVPCKGARSLWDMPAEVLAQMAPAPQRAAKAGPVQGDLFSSE